MKQFFKFTLASMVGTLLSGLLLFFIVGIVIVGAIVSSASEIGKEKNSTVENNSILHLTLNNLIVERGTENEFNLPGSPFGGANKEGLNTILASIRKAKSDTHIKGIYLDLSATPAGWASLKEIRDVLLDFKTSGKWIISYGEIYTQGAYYLASTADKIYLYPLGEMQLTGLASNVLYLKGALDKLGVEVQVVRGKNNKFKSAAEPFLATEMSDANREQISVYLNAIWNVWLTEVSASRKIPVDSLQLMANELRIRNGKAAVANKLIDKLVYKDELLAELARKSGVDSGEDLKLISLKKYSNSSSNDEDENKDSDKKVSKDKIAVIYAEGGIEDGKGSEPETIYSVNLSEAIRKARNDDKVKAVVLRVNSPGGSALASDVIWREVVLTKKVKPVVVSMGDYAASGGYYISAVADRIFAEPTTITGSIGVFGLIPNAEKLINSTGLNFEEVKTNKYSILGGIDRKLSDDEYAIIQGGVEDIYSNFIQVVAEGRKKTLEQIDSIAQGRVWTGTDALRLGLVDELGGLDKAIKAAAKLAKIENYKLLELPKIKDPFTQFIQELTGEELQVKYMQKMLGNNIGLYNQYKYLNEISRIKGVQMRMPYLVEAQ